jgi:D-3-phosphoglycerate dehydrogenase
MDAARLGLLAPGAILVNTARARIVDEFALRRALASGQVRHVGLDVFEDEPLSPDHAWQDVHNVTLTAHAAYMTDEAYAELWAKALQSLRDVQSGS